jgi:hypothetical protein
MAAAGTGCQRRFLQLSECSPGAPLRRTAIQTGPELVGGARSVGGNRLVCCRSTSFPDCLGGALASDSAGPRTTDRRTTDHDYTISLEPLMDADTDLRVARSARPAQRRPRRACDLRESAVHPVNTGRGAGPLGVTAVSVTSSRTSQASAKIFVQARHAKSGKSREVDLCI